MQREKSKLIPVPSSVYRLPEVESDTDYDLEEMTEKCKSFLQEHCVRGDILLFSDEPDQEYRNDKRFAYDGKKIINLFYDYIDYGTVPLEFLTFIEFPPAYFSDSVTHNTICWVLVTAGLKEELIANAQPCGGELWKSWVMIAGEKRQFRLICGDVRACLGNRIFSFADQDYLICSGVDYEEAFESGEGEIAYLFDI